MGVICIWFALFVTSQFYVIFTFPNQRFGEDFDTICIFFYTRSPYFTCHCIEHKCFKLGYRRKIHSVEHRKCAVGLAGAHPYLQDRILLNYTRIEKVCTKTCFSVMYRSQQTLNFPFFLLRHYQCLNASVLTIVVFELVQ